MHKIIDIVFKNHHFNEKYSIDRKYLNLSTLYSNTYLIRYLCAEALGIVFHEKRIVFECVIMGLLLFPTREARRDSYPCYYCFHTLKRFLLRRNYVFAFSCVLLFRLLTLDYSKELKTIGESVFVYFVSSLLLNVWCDDGE